MVADVIVETPDTSTLVLFTGNDRLDYKAGHFLTIDPHQFGALAGFTAFLEHLKGRSEPPRAYSMCSAPHERYLAVTVKEERFVPNVTKYPPLLSPLLVKRTVRGMGLVVTGFTGPYTLPTDVTSQTDHVVHVCAGSGSVPNMSILKSALEHHPTLRHTFIYSNKTWEDVIYRDTLAKLAATHPDRLRVIHTLTREQNASIYGASVQKGRLDNIDGWRSLPLQAEQIAVLLNPLGERGALIGGQLSLQDDHRLAARPERCSDVGLHFDRRAERDRQMRFLIDTPGFQCLADQVVSPCGVIFGLLPLLRRQRSTPEPRERFQ